MTNAMAQGFLSSSNKALDGARDQMQRFNYDKAEEETKGM